MASKPAHLRVGSARASARDRVRALRPEETAWIAAVPCALVTITAIVLVGPFLGRHLFSPGSETFWPTTGTRPQPLEHGRFVMGLIGPPLLAAAVLAGTSRPVRWPGTSIRTLVGVSQLIAVGFVAICLAAQNNVIFSADFILQPHTRYFTVATLATAALLAALPFAVLRRRGIVARLVGIARETRARHTAGILLAALFIVIWLLASINVDSSIGNTNEAVPNHVLWAMNEAFAVLNGRTPLVNFHAQYGQLWAYIAALPMAAFGATVGTFTLTMTSASGLAMLAIYAVFRHVTRSSLLALALFLPFLATSFFIIVGPADDRYGPASLYMVWPVRYAGPYLLAWLTARHVDGRAPHRPWLIFLLGGLVLLNNPEFGSAALGATFVAMACPRAPPVRATVVRLLGGLAVGLAAAIALVCLLTLARSGELPRFGLLFEFSRYYGLGGWAMLPMPVIGLHLVVFLTFAAAFVLAIVRVVARAANALLSAMLVWSGVFGLLGAGYYAGRAHPGALFELFSPWSLTVGLLVVVVAGDLGARRWRAPTLPELMILFAFGIAICSLAQIPTPWSQIARIRDRTPFPVLKQREAVQLVAKTTGPNERVAILVPLSHRIAYDAGVVNVAPYSSIEAMPTRQQLQALVDQLHRAHVHKVYISGTFTFGEELALLTQAGFAPRARAGAIYELNDAAAA